MNYCKQNDFYRSNDIDNGLFEDSSSQPWVEHVLKSIKEWNEDNDIYFFHAVFRVTKGGKSEYYDYIGHQCNDDEGQEKLLAYLNATLRYFCEYGTTINTPLPNGRKRAGVAHIVVEEETDNDGPNICCPENSSIEASDIKRIVHTKFDYNDVIQEERSNDPGNYITGCLKVTLRQECTGECQCCGLKYLSVSSGLKLNDDKMNNYGENGYIEQAKEEQSIIKDKDYYGFGASIFYVTDNIRDVSEEYIKDVMAILNVEMLKDFVKMHNDLKSIKESTHTKNQKLERYLADLTEGAEGLVTKIKETKLYLNDDAHNFIDLVSSDDFKRIFEGTYHNYQKDNRTDQEGQLKELFLSDKNVWQYKKIQKDDFWNGKLTEDSFEAIKGLRDLRGNEPSLPIDTLLWLFLGEPKCNEQFGSKTSNRKVDCNPEQAKMFVKGVMLLADQPEEDLKYAIQKEDTSTTITFDAKEGGDLETLCKMVTDESDNAHEGYHLNTFILRSLVAKGIGNIEYNNSNNKGKGKDTITITYNFNQGGEQ